MSWIAECKLCEAQEVVANPADALSPHWVSGALCPGSAKPGLLVGPASGGVREERGRFGGDLLCGGDSHGGTLKGGAVCRLNRPVSARL